MFDGAAQPVALDKGLHQHCLRDETWHRAGCSYLHLTLHVVRKFQQVIGLVA